jgi:hypothetical protein
VSDPSFAQTLATIEVRDATGGVFYQKTFPQGVKGGKFQRSLTASARLLSGKYCTGVLLKAPPIDENDKIAIEAAVLSSSA